MKLKEALRILNASAGEHGKPLSVYLACGFQPTHLAVFLAAHLRNRLSGRPVKIHEGLYGDLIGNVQRANGEGVDAVAVFLEWSDFDPRLGLRGASKWTPDILKDIAQTVSVRARLIERAIVETAGSLRTAICLPTIPLPPIFHCHPTQVTAASLELQLTVDSMALGLAQLSNAAVVNPLHLHHVSPFGSRFHVNSELMFGHPYSKPHASIVAGSMVEVLYPSPPKKGLITDLDDTLWRGILGDAGVDGVNWHLDDGSRMHGLYQQLLGSLTASGVFVGVATKNDPKLVFEAFNRGDLLLDPSRLFPVEAHWGSKAESITRILGKWNIGEDSVVFVDDSPMELDLVKSQFPSIEVIRFPTHDNQQIYDLLQDLRRLFGKATIQDEDLIRVDSLRAGRHQPISAPEKATDSEDYLAQLRAEFTFSFKKDLNDSRSFDLVNKTNQFNINGERYTHGEWRSFLNCPDTFMLTVSYTDKFGPLGKIAVIAGLAGQAHVELKTWVMSCRAFGRRIEHACLSCLFEHFGVTSLLLHCRPSDRNGPAFDFINSICPDGIQEPTVVTRGDFESLCPPLSREHVEIVDD